MAGKVHYSKTCSEGFVQIWSLTKKIRIRILLIKWFIWVAIHLEIYMLPFLDRSKFKRCIIFSEIGNRHAFIPRQITYYLILDFELYF